MTPVFTAEISLMDLHTLKLLFTRFLGTGQLFNIVKECFLFNTSFLFDQKNLIRLKLRFTAVCLSNKFKVVIYFEVLKEYICDMCSSYYLE